MQDKQAEMDQQLERLLAGEGVLGAAFVSRDGIPLLSRFTPKFDQVAFSILVEGAMVATLVGSAEEALAELEAGPMERTIVESGKMRMIVQCTADDIILLVLTDRATPIDALNEHIDQVAGPNAPSAGG